MQNNYDIFSGEDLKIADLIQRRRLQLLIHSCIYYELNANLISDKQWDCWARELVELQKTYPEISSKVVYAEAFKDWDVSTGAFLPIKDEDLVGRANFILRCSSNNFKNVTPTKTKPKEVKKPKPATPMRLF